MTAELEWNALSPFGVEVRLDLRQDVDQRRIETLLRLLDRHHLLLFRGQDIDVARHMEVCSWFGPVPPKDPSTFDSKDRSLVLGDSELAFHSDLSCAPDPVIALSLYAVEVEEGASPTHFVDAMAPVSRLAAGLRAQLAGLHTMNLWPINLAKRQRKANAPIDWPGAVHSVLKQHPRTGDPIIYVNASHTDRIVELPEVESESVIQELFTLLYDPANLYVHNWRNGDLLIWDNLALQHARPQSPDGIVRRLQRVEVATADYAAQMPPELMAFYSRR